MTIAGAGPTGRRAVRTRATTGMTETADGVAPAVEIAEHLGIVTGALVAIKGAPGRPTDTKMSMREAGQEAILVGEQAATTATPVVGQVVEPATAMTVVRFEVVFKYNLRTRLHYYFLSQFRLSTP